MVLTCHSLQSSCPAKRNRVTELYSCQNCEGRGRTIFQNAVEHSGCTIQFHFDPHLSPQSMQAPKKLCNCGALLMHLIRVKQSMLVKKNDQKSLHDLVQHSPDFEIFTMKCSICSLTLNKSRKRIRKVLTYVAKKEEW